MVNGYRIKTVIFPQVSVTGSVMSEVYTNFDIDGEILKVAFTNVNTPGSVWLRESGIGTDILKVNNLTSGTANVEYYPIAYGTIGTAGVTGSPQAYTYNVVNSKLYIAGSGMTSGTSTKFGPVTVYYR